MLHVIENEVFRCGHQRLKLKRFIEDVLPVTENE